jgi:uncharacterized protein DUF6461
VAATSPDYRWIRTWHNGLLVTAYCLTLVRDLSADDLLDRLGVDERRHEAGIDRLGRASMEAWSVYEGRRQLVAVTTVLGWAIMLEHNGYVGVTREIMVPASRGTAVVSHFRNVNALDEFLWLEDGVVLVEFEPLFPDRRSGIRAGDFGLEMTAAGFDVRGQPDRDVEECTESAFALAERLTGVRVTSELLDGATYVIGLASLPM